VDNYEGFDADNAGEARLYQTLQRGKRAGIGPGMPENPIVFTTFVMASWQCLVITAANTIW
jgi:hypothetical protein